FGIYSRWIPDRTSSRPVKRHAIFVLAARSGFFRNHKRSPQLLSGIGVESNDVTAERAAFIGENRARSRFHRGHWNVDPAVVNGCGACTLGSRMIAGPDFPQHLAGLSIQRVDTRQHVYKIDGVPG